MTDDDLDQFFAAARADAPRPGAALQARVIAEAEALVPGLVQSAPHKAAPRPGLWSALAALFGGSGVLAGMATATIAGFWIGFAQPVQLGAMSAVLTGTSAEIDMMPGLDALLDEAP